MPGAAPSLVAAHPDVEPHLLPSTGPRAAQRARILDAISRVVAAKGYAAATVTDVVRAARVSRGTFYELFDSKERCFLDAYAHGTDVLLARVRAGARAASSDDWRDALRGGMQAYLGTLAAEPLFARTYLLEIHAAGAAAQALRDDVLRRFAEEYARSLRAARRTDADLRRPTADELFVLAAGIDQLICARVRDHGVERLPAETDRFVRTAVALLEGAATTTRSPR
ncbi:TetR/AcrR family transcriptional regulator [Paraconexibacter sp.]|uniref:TetR/AcrR family transcriptional regulator n=1 Tax=Paraconexibacter sp. TaxID=2949640 RepID=UPI00356AACA2